MAANVAVIGAAGHVGLGLCLCMADAGHEVIGVDTNRSAVSSILSGNMPFVEAGAESLLRRMLAEHRFTLTTNLSAASGCDVIVVILGTPIDENLNPVVLPLIKLLRDLKPYLRRDQLVILRSTVSPGTADSVRTTLENLTGLEVGNDIFLVFAPERVVQGRSLEEIPNLPQLIGAYDDASFQRADEFFSTFVKNKCIRLTPVEAELSKLMCNMARYVTFAIANEFSLIAREYNANIHRIFEACSFEYPRFNLPSPGPNVAGPCLFKDGFFLIERIPFPELVLTAFKINESMPMHIFKMIRAKPEIHKVAILGMAFKAGSDDTRYSLSFKLKKLLEGSGYEVVTFDPYVQQSRRKEDLKGAECAVLMTTHPEFRDFTAVADTIAEDRCWYVDLWGFWPEVRQHAQNGTFYRWELEGARRQQKMARRSAA